MKKLIVVLIIIGCFLLVFGSGIFTLGLKNQQGNTDMTKTYNFDENTINSIDIDFSTSNIELIVSNDETKKVVCNETEKEYHTVEVVEGTLKIRKIDERKWYEKIFAFDFRKKEVKVYLPSSTRCDVLIKGSTGKIKVNEGFSFKSVDIKTSTGDIDLSSKAEYLNIKVSTGDVLLNKINTSSLNISGGTGDINIKDTNVSGEIKINVSTGKVKIEDVKSTFLDIESSTGKVSITNTIINGDMKVDISTGDLSIKDSDAETLKITMGTGDITGNLLSSKIFNVKSSTGKISVPSSTSGGLCEITTSTGDILITINE